MTTGFLVKFFNWRMAFAVPGVLRPLLGVALALLAKPLQNLILLRRGF